MRSFFLPLILASLFFIIGVVRISSYGINWDEPIHFFRGQAYLNFFLSGGKTTYDFSQVDKKSIYKDKNHEVQYYLENDCCHPVLNGILYSLSNKIFFEKLSLLPDIEAYNLAGIALSSLLIFFLAWFVSREFDIISGFITGISLSIYPLFLAETHFNVKDPPETVFYSLCLIFIYYAVKKISWKAVLLAGIFFGLAWGTKFNILFLPFLIAPWLLYFFFRNRNKPLFKKLSTKLLLVLLIPLIAVMGFLIFFVSWPYLWQSPFHNIMQVFAWYRHIGTSTNYEPSFLLYGFNLYPALWIVFATPLSVLLLSTVGIYSSIHSIVKRDKNQSLLILVLLWFLIPIVRVSLPNFSIYGGVRQIMEYVPAMAVLSGIGFSYLLKKLKSKTAKKLTILLVAGLFIFNIIELVKIHPNEAVYFNQLAGGLKGAYKKHLTEAGGDLGNVYRQGADWLNRNAENNAKLTLINNGVSAIPFKFLRPDIRFSEDFWSADKRQGEYIMNTTQAEWDLVIPEKSSYVKSYLKPIHEVKVDGVAILKIWKNSY